MPQKEEGDYCWSARVRVTPPKNSCGCIAWNFKFRQTRVSPYKFVDCFIFFFCIDPLVGV